jgi:hypothetical protein
MGGYDYHGQGRNTGETRTPRGPLHRRCQEYAARMNKPRMIYVFSDGSLSANGMVNTCPCPRQIVERVPSTAVRAGLPPR